MHGRNGRRDIADGAKRDPDAGGVRDAYAYRDARDGHADCCSNSESNRDGHSDDGSQPGPDRDGESAPEHRADCNHESQSYAESDADAGAHADENTGAHKGADHASSDANSHQMTVSRSACGLRH